MGEAIVNNLGGILTGGALLVTAIGTLVNIWFTQRNRWQITNVEKKVDGGMTQLQEALAEIAKTATAATTAPRSSRRTDKVESEP